MSTKVFNMELKIISGGQTGVDMAALDAALKVGFPIGGWCPKGRLSEAGTIPLAYSLKETPSPDASQRTEWNVRDSDATLIISPFPVVSNGTAYTLKMIEKHNKPFVVLNCDQLLPASNLVTCLSQWVNDLGINVLNIAGPRESKVPGIYRNALNFLVIFFRRLRTIA